MSKQKLLKKVLAGSKNIRFDDMVTLIRAFGFELARVSGSHHIFIHPAVNELVNLQNVNGQAKRLSGATVSEVSGTLQFAPGGRSMKDYHYHLKSGHI